MARLLNDDLSPATGAPPVGSLTAPDVAPEPSRVPASAPLAALTGRAVLTGALVAGLAAGLLLAVALANPAPGPVGQSPELAGLLRGMVLIKGLILTAAAAMVWARLGRAVRPGVLIGYAVTLGLAAGGLGWLWGLSLLPVGSLLFWGGLVGAFWVANRDPDLLRGLLPRGDGAPMGR